MNIKEIKTAIKYDYSEGTLMNIVYFDSEGLTYHMENSFSGVRYIKDAIIKSTDSIKSSFIKSGCYIIISTNFKRKGLNLNNKTYTFERKNKIITVPLKHCFFSDGNKLNASLSLKAYNLCIKLQEELDKQNENKKITK